ncbi:MAG: 6-phosphogluconolactonase [Candidatus Pacebacteria bacterium]|nr:6-phosphogluconolactonase [Candidatus Paceibacterota bacterium]
MLTIHRSGHPLEEASTQLNTLLHEVHGKDTLLLLSGGSALALTDHLDTSLLGPHVTVSVLDERWTYEEKDSNFAQLIALPFWHKALKAGVAYIDPRPHEPENVHDTAKRFDLALKHWHVTHRNGVVLATVGIGEDGHVAGVLPMPHEEKIFSALFLHTTTCIRGYTTLPTQTNRHTKRMTVTLTYFTRHVHHAIIYAVGKGKHPALLSVQEKEGHLAQTPARIVHTLKNGHLYTDVL